MIEVEALRNGMYAGKRFKAGDKFTIASHRDYKIYIAAKLAKDAPAAVIAPKAESKPHTYSTKVIYPQAVSVQQVEDTDPTFIPVEIDEDKPKRAYKRRDMKAED